ncbi:hypothetical protein C8J57DRAFT_1236665 [Mycena rebaudengoi]|nr:hypothetical protein C8J57DRAFT_1236665 [Mycena rebaudengoi]
MVQRTAMVVMYLAWLQAKKPGSQSHGFVSQAKPITGLVRAWLWLETCEAKSQGLEPWLEPNQTDISSRASNLPISMLLPHSSHSGHVGSHAGRIGLTPSASYYVVPSPFQERSSSKRKDLFRRIQGRHEDTPAEVAKQMVLDMKVRWSTTYAMLDTRFNLKEHAEECQHKSNPDYDLNL